MLLGHKRPICVSQTLIFVKEHKFCWGPITFLWDPLKCPPVVPRDFSVNYINIPLYNSVFLSYVS